MALPLVLPDAWLVGRADDYAWALAYYQKHGWRDLGLRPATPEATPMELDLGAGQRAVYTPSHQNSQSSAGSPMKVLR